MMSKPCNRSLHNNIADDNNAHILESEDALWNCRFTSCGHIIRRESTRNMKIPTNDDRGLGREIEVIV